MLSALHQAQVQRKFVFFFCEGTRKAICLRCFSYYVFSFVLKAVEVLVIAVVFVNIVFFTSGFNCLILLLMYCSRGSANEID